MTALVLTEGRPQKSSPDSLFQWLEGAGDAVALDTETTGFDWDAKTRMVQLADDRGAFAVDVTTDSGRDLVRDAIWYYRGTLVFHNLQFDARALRYITDPDYIWMRGADTYVLAQTYASELNNGLDDLTARILGQSSDWKKNFRKQMKKHKWTWETVPRLVLAPYGLADARATWLLYEWFLHNMSAAEWRCYQKEMEAAQAIAEMQERGLRLGVEYATRLQTDWRAEQLADEAWFAPRLAPYAHTNVEVLTRWAEKGVLETKANPNSNDQIARYLIDRGWVPTEHTPTLKPRLDKAVLLGLEGKYELVDRLIQYKRRGKWLAAYVDNCIEAADEDGLVHARYNSLGTITRRMSCSEPPLQQLPKGGGGVIRSMFIAREGNVIASVDYSAIELRLAGHLSDEPAIISAFNEGRDLYQDLADALGTSRDVAKVVMLASLYGWQGWEDKAGLVGSTLTERQSLIARFWQTYPALSAFAYNCSRKAQVETALWRHHIRPRSRHAGVNAVIQGTAAEVMKEGLLRLGEAGLLRFVVAVVHDEVVLDVPEQHAEALVAEVAEILTDRRFNPVLVAEGKVYGHSWGEGYNH